jgi:hypothetical protein
VIKNNPNKNVIISMSIKQGFRYPKKRKGKETPPPILVNSNEGSFIREKRSNNATRSFYVS